MEGSETAGDAAGDATAFSERPAASRLVERDVEAPEVFQTNDKGLWDGRPSLGGVWVAYSEVNDPERVIIRNMDNGKFVIGALFKREREHPGPKIQVSSDAATALGMLAGAPTSLNVTALRREEPAPTTETPNEAVSETDATDVAEDATIASAAAAIDRAETGDTVEGVAEAATETVGDAVAAETPKRGWNPFKRKAKTSTDTATDMVDATTVAAAAGKTTATDVAEEVASATTDVLVIEPEPAKKRGWNPFKRKNQDVVTPASVTADTAALAAGAITAQSLDPAPRVIADEPAAAPEARQTTSRLDKPYVQIGIFSVEDNANNTATSLRQNGVVPQVYEQKSSGKTFWRVVAGPVNTKVDRASLVKKVKGMGFEDAYPVGG
ncbi:SPOR domain-containing protein [Tropicimonas sp. TH_r6]|uniref:SPOR domain-containing protein n=1 Tax=Tropicimonas sp. TH_r6 TaxID=3082085 RepID=UPI00398709BE